MARPREEEAARAASHQATAAAGRFRSTILDRLPERSLARLGALLGVPAGAAPAVLAAAVARPGGGARLLAALRAPDRRALVGLFRLGGVVLLASAKDAIPGAGVDAARKSLGALLEIGLLARLRVAGTLFLTIPPGLHDLVAQPCRDALAEAGLLDEPKEPLDPGPPLRSLLAALLSIAEKEPLRVTQTGTFFARQAEKIAGQFKLTALDSELLAVMVELLARFEALKKVDGAWTPQWVAARELLARLDDAAAAALLMDHATRAARPLVRLLSVATTLDGVATNDGWVPVDALVARDFPVLLADGFETALAGGEDPSAMREDVLARVTLLAASRLVEVAGPEAGAPPSHVRPAAALRALMAAGEDGPTPSAAASGDAPRAIAQPSFDVLVPADADGATWATIAQFGELREADRVSRFALTQTRLYKALDAGPLRLEEFLAFLAKRTAHGLPQNVEQSIRSWAKGYGEIEFVEGLVARCRSQAARDSLLGVKDAVAEELGDGVFLLKPGYLDAVLKKAEADGHTPSRRVRRASPQPAREGGVADAAASPMAFPDPKPLRDAIAKVPPPRGTLLVDSGESLLVDVGPDRPGPPPPQAFKRFLKGVLGEGLEEFLEFVGNRELRELQDLFLSGRTHEFEKKLDRILERYEEEERLRGRASDAKPVARSPLLGRPPTKSELLDRLTAAVDEAADIEIEYREGGGPAKLHRVTPEEIVHRGVTPYLGGYCHETGEQRLFKLSLISRVLGARGPDEEPGAEE